MAVTDSIADALTVIRNGCRAGKTKVEIKASKLLEAMVKLLKEEGFIENHKRVEDNKQDMIHVYLRYINGDKKQPAITDLQKISKSGRRVYVDRTNVPRVLNGMGIAIMSTSSGVLTDKTAREKGIGGEVICYVW